MKIPTYRLDAYALVRNAFKRLGYTFFTADNDCNFFGVRSADRHNPNDGFNDLLGCAMIYNWEPSVWVWPGTTDPGAHFLVNPMAAGGAAIVVPGQYRGVWQFGLHYDYQALIQTGGKIKVYRDNNRDASADFDGPIQEGFYGINLHHSGRNLPPPSDPTVGDKRILNWSAGCQVFRDLSDFQEGLGLAHEQVKAHPTWTSFTYTLFTLAAHGRTERASPELEALFALHRE